MLFKLYQLGKISPRKFFGSMRVVAYGLVVSTGLFALTVRNAVADAEDQSLALGRKLAEVGDLVNGGTNEFRLNGQPVYFSTTTTTQSIKTVLDRFETFCNKSPSLDVEHWKLLAATSHQEDPFEKRGMSRLGVIRKEDDPHGDGMVMCFMGDHGPQDFVSALKAFESSGDLHDIGDLRYVHVKQRPKGKLLVQTMWTDGSFNIRTLMGTPGRDSVGSDFVSLPRPIDSTRRFTAEAIHTAYAARIYESKASPEAVMDDYKQKMTDAGWLIVRSPYQQFADGQDGRWFSKLETGEQAAISVSRSGDATMVVVGSAGVIEKPPTVTRQE
jgi:hypothetical protein